jgi:serine/threonine protein phosphatase PrpC
MDLEYYVSQFSSNDPGEDRFSSRYHPEFGSFFCVIDGHGGCFSCDLTNTFILDFFLEGLQKLPKPLNSSADIIQILNETFQRCDERILQEAVRIRNLNPDGMCLHSNDTNP